VRQEIDAPAPTPGPGPLPVIRTPDLKLPTAVPYQAVRACQERDALSLLVNQPSSQASRET